MSDTLQETAVAATTARLSTLRGNCMGAAVLLIFQFGIGIGVNLYVEVPKNKAFLPAVFSSATLAAHAIVALVLLAAAISARESAANVYPLTISGLRFGSRSDHEPA